MHHVSPRQILVPVFATIPAFLGRRSGSGFGKGTPVCPREVQVGAASLKRCAGGFFRLRVRRVQKGDAEEQGPTLEDFFPAFRDRSPDNPVRSKNMLEFTAGCRMGEQFAKVGLNKT